MFVIPCKYSKISNSIITLVKQIREFHPLEKIVVVDSDSSDKSYFELLNPYNVIIEDISNKNWMIGAYWYCYKKYNETFFYFLHDSMKVKANLDYLKNNELTILCYFNRIVNWSFNAWNGRINEETQYKITTDNGLGVYGPIFFCHRKLLDSLNNKGFMDILPTSKAETGYMEGALGTIFELEGFELHKCALYGDVLANESPGGSSGSYPFNTSWQYPIEKFYASHYDQGRN